MSPTKILFIAYHFPPDAAVGAIRPAKFVKYLKQLGWEPIVLTICQDHIPVSDYGRLKELGHVPTIRTRVWPTILQLVLRVRDACRRNAQRDGGGTTASSAVNPQGGAVRGVSPPKKSGSLIKAFLSLSEIPDDAIGWLIPAVWNAYWLVKKHDIRFVVTSSPPRTTAVVGLALSYLTEIYLLTDLRDPWFRPMEGLIVAKPQAWIANELLGWFENKIMERSSHVITTTKHYHTYLRSFYVDLGESRFSTIWNGYDEEDFRELEAIKPGARFTISYLGTFYFGRSPKSFLQALNELVTEGELDRSRLEVRFVGDVCYAEGESVEELIQFYDLTDCVRLSGPIPYEDALLAMKQSNVLLLIAPDQYYCIPAKTFEYLASQRSILCLSKDGPTADLIKETGSGAVLEPDDIQRIKSAILQFYAEYKQGSMVDYKNEIRKFERKRLTADLSRLLEASISGG